MLKHKRLLAVLLASVLVVSLIPSTVFADTQTGDQIAADTIESSDEFAFSAEDEITYEDDFSVTETEEGGDVPEVILPDEAEELPEIILPEDEDEDIVPEDMQALTNGLSELDDALSVELAPANSREVSQYTFTDLSDFDVDRYMADILVNNPAEYGTMHLFLESETPAEIIESELDKDTAFQAAVASWELLTFDIVETVEEAINTCGITEEQYYEVVLLDMISQSLLSEDTLNIVHNSYSTDLYNNFELAAEMVGYIGPANIADKITSLSSITMDAQEMEEFLGEFSKDFGEVAGVMNKIAIVTGNLAEGVEKLTAYRSLRQFCEKSLGETLGKMEKLCPSTNLGMKMAIHKIKSLCKESLAGLILDTVLDHWPTDPQSGITATFAIVMDGALTTLVKGAGLLPLLAGQALGKGIANLSFNSDRTLELYYMMSAHADMLKLVRKAVLQAESDVKDSNTRETARYLIDSMALYYSCLETGCDYALDFATALYEGKTLIDHFPEAVYTQFAGHCTSIKKSYRNAHEYMLLDMWECYFCSEHYKLYNELMAQLGRPGGTKIEVERIYFSNAAATWNLYSGTRYLYANVLPEDASNKSVEYSSSNESVVSVSRDGVCTLKKEGTAVLTATALDGSEVSGSMTVTVTYGNSSFTNSEGSLEYIITGDDEVSVYGLNYTNTSYSVPPNVVDSTGAEAKMYKVTAIASMGFTRSKKYLESIELPDTIREIGTEAFKDCSKLTTVDVPGELQKIGSYAFSGCEKLENLDLSLAENLYEIGPYALKSTHLKTVDLPVSLKTIGTYAFEYSDIEEITIPRNVMSIGEHAFAYCYDLKRVYFDDLCYAAISKYCFRQCTGMEQIELGRRVSSIGLYAFSGCKSLTEITIPASVGKIERDVFGSCESLTKISVSTNNPYFSSENGVLFDKDKTTLICYPISKAGTIYEIPETVTRLVPQSFCENKYLEEVVLPDGLVSIETQAFSEAQSLKQLIMPNTVTYLGTAICEQCPALEYVKLSSSLTTVPKGSFYQCKALTKVDIYDGVEEIEESAFESCALTEFDFPDTLTKIGIQAFAYNRSLKKAIIPDSVYQISHRAFQYCEALETLHLPDSLYRLFDAAFNHTAVKEIVIPEGITEIPKSAFSENKSLTSVTVPTSVTTICENAFWNDDNLSKLILLGSRPNIYSKAFYYVEDLTIYYPGYDSSYDNLPETKTREQRWYAEALTWKVDPNNRVSVSKCKIKLSSSNLTYTGKALLPKVVLTYNGSTVSKSNYSVTGKDNKNPGIATITIKGKNGLKGSKELKVKICPAAPKISSASNGTKGITLKWSKVSNAKGYNIYRDNKKIKSISGNTTVKYQDTGAKKNGTAYTYTVRAYVKAKDGTVIESADSAQFKAYYLATPTCKLTNSEAGKLTVKWDQNKKASGYQVKYTVGSKSKMVNVKKGTTVSTVLSVKKGNTCKVCVRSYTTYNGEKVYSAWSAEKSLKIGK